ncbi:MAG: B12-binding domain-containing radical SAM protein [Phycisphaerales bacterium]|nr:B12-binding domain-containing radical SAM protein [Phycisphaerales bacterium]
MKTSTTIPDVLLVQPPYPGPYNFWKSECLGMGYLAAALEKRGYVVHVLDAFLMEMDVEAVLQHIRNAPPRLLLGFSMLTYELYRTGESILRRLRAEGFNTHVTVGSWFPTFWHRTMIEEGFTADSIVIGEGERSICALADYLKTGSWSTDGSFLKREKIGNTLVLHQNATLSDIDSLPPPRRDYLPEAIRRYYLATAYTARGCGHSHCTFCSVPLFYKGGPKHRLRSPKNVIDEVETISRMGADFLFFVDEDFIGESPEGPKRTLKIFEGIAERGISMRFTFNCRIRSVEKELFKPLADLGLAAVYIGMESNINRMLKLFAKGASSDDIYRSVGILHDLGVKIVPGWIMFERDTSLDEVEEQIKFLLGINTYHVNFLKPLYVMKDTPMEKMYGDELYRTFFDRKYYFKDPDVDLLVRILSNDYLPEVMPHTNGIYHIWHKLLAYGTGDHQRRYDFINSRMRELSLSFASELIGRIRSRSLNGLARTLSDHAQEWWKINCEIDDLAKCITQQPQE